MDNRNSIERLKSIQLSLSELSNSLEETYFKMRQECKDEIIKDIKTHDTKKNEMYNLYEQLSNSEQRRINYIKNRLPWYVTIFRTMHSYEISLRDTSISAVRTANSIMMPRIMNISITLSFWGLSQIGNCRYYVAQASSRFWLCSES